MTIQEYVELDVTETGDCELLQEVEDFFRQRIMDCFYSEAGTREVSDKEIAWAFRDAVASVTR